MGLFYRAARVPEGREEVENGAQGEGSRALCLSQSGSEPLPNPMLTQSAAEVSLVGTELVTGSSSAKIHLDSRSAEDSRFLALPIS